MKGQCRLRPALRFDSQTYYSITLHSIVTFNIVAYGKKVFNPKKTANLSQHGNPLTWMFCSNILLCIRPPI